MSVVQQADDGWQYVVDTLSCPLGNVEKALTHSVSAGHMSKEEFVAHVGQYSRTPGREPGRAEHSD